MTISLTLRQRLVCLGLLIGIAPLAVRGAETDDARYHWFSVPIEVSGLPPDAQFVPVSCPIDLTVILSRWNVSGAVDERSLRLFRLLPDGTQAEQPVQFTGAPQPGPKTRRLLPDTASGVSYLTEYAAHEKAEIKVAGTLTWIAQAGEKGSGRYRLKCGVPRDGRLIQVPYPPQNLRVFDGQGRATPLRYFPRMQIRPQWPLDGVVQLSEQQQLITAYHVGPTLDQAKSPASSIRRPFLYPVIGPDGVPLTEFGKPHDPTGSHAHHYSLWIAHASVGGQDFWSEKGGVIAHEQLEYQEDGPVYCRLVQTTRWLRDNVDYLHERRSLTVYRAAQDFRLLDLDLEFTPAGSEATELGKTPFGFLAVRVAQSMTPFDGGGEIVNARGDRNETAALWKRAAWLDQSGPIAAGTAELSDGASPAPARWGGIAIFDHPDNVNHPTVWHCRNDGWAGAALNAEGPTKVRAGEKLRLRYRIYLHRHNAIEGQVAERYEEYRSPPALRSGEPVKSD
ncbi:MAG: PmoA family protein [Planctomycetota bacterium]|nr:PmoA family protein [Planctomycetota bacterium]